MKYVKKEYNAPLTDIFQLGNHERLMQDPLPGTGTHVEPEGGEGF